MDAPTISSSAEAIRHEQSPQSAPTPAHRWTDLGLVLMFPFVPSIANSVYLLWHSQPARLTNGTILSGFFAEVSTLILFAVLYCRQGRKLSALGLGFQWTDLPKGLGLFFISFTAFWVASYTVARLGHTIPFSWSAGMLSATSPWYVVPFLFLNPFFEEIVVRGYLMTEIIELRSSTVMATLISLAFQTSYHVHYGILGALCLALGLAFFAVYYAKSRRLMPVILAHLFWDLTTLLGAWHR
jgi:membrane protease YdiL (CAAX protease family)